MENVIALCALVQATSTISLVIITWCYMKQTKRQADLNVEPRVNIMIPEDIFTKNSDKAKIVNHSKCEVEDIAFQVSVRFRDMNGPLPVCKCIDSKFWNKSLKPKKYIPIDVRKYFGPQVEVSAMHDLPPGVELLTKEAIFEVSFRRVVDGKEFCFSESYSIVPDDAGQAKIVRSSRHLLKSLDKKILKLVEKDIQDLKPSDIPINYCSEKRTTN